jgi:glucose-1-phosphate adenylyltransferase
VPGATDRDRGYWRDVGTMRSYYDAHLDVVSPLPVFNLYNGQWPIYANHGPQPPVKLAKGADGTAPVADEALFSPGVVITGGEVRPSVLSPAVRVDQGALVEDSVLMDNVFVGAGAVVRNAILDKAVRVPPGAQIGVDQEADVQRGFMVEDGLTVLGKGHPFPD